MQLTKTRLKEKRSKLEEVKRLAAIEKALLASPRRDIVREIDGAHFGDQTIGRRLTGRCLETRHDAARMGRATTSVSPLSSGSRAMICSRLVSTTRPIANFPISRMVSRITAKAPSAAVPSA